LLESLGGDGVSILGHGLANFFSEWLYVFGGDGENVEALVSH